MLENYFEKAEKRKDSMLFFEVMKDGQKHMTAVKKDKETLALV